MLTNYYNVGFIHLLYPNALILHVAREPMDTIFSAYKHEFPPGTLDYTSDFEALAELYHAYRDLMEHWDKVLPGRVTHVRYQDMVHDMPGIARAIIGKPSVFVLARIVCLHLFVVSNPPVPFRRDRIALGRQRAGVSQEKARSQHLVFHTSPKRRVQG